MDFKLRDNKYWERYLFWEASGKSYVSFYYLTLAVVLIELLFSNIITLLLGGLCLLMSFFIVPYGIWNKIGNTNYIEEVNKATIKEKREKEKEKKEERKRANAEEKERQNEIKKLCELHGDEFGEAVYNNELRVGMDKPAVTESWGDSGLKKRSKWYYASEKRLNIVYFKSSKVSEIVEGSDPFELDMEKDEVIALWGEPEDEKKTVYKTKTKLRWYYFSRTTRQYTTAYRYHVDLEDDLVVGWKELE